MLNYGQKPARVHPLATLLPTAKRSCWYFSYMPRGGRRPHRFPPAQSTRYIHSRRQWLLCKLLLQLLLGRRTIIGRETLIHRRVVSFVLLVALLYSTLLDSFRVRCLPALHASLPARSGSLPAYSLSIKIIMLIIFSHLIFVTCLRPSRLLARSSAAAAASPLADHHDQHRCRLLLLLLLVLLPENNDICSRRGDMRFISFWFLFFSSVRP